MSLILSGTDGLSDVDGSAATPAIRGTDANTGIFFPAADTIAFAEGGAEVARFDSSGNFGLGVTPSAWSLIKGLQVTGGGFFGSYLNNSYMGANWYFDGTSKYIASDFATQYEQNDGKHIWYTAPSGTAGNAISFTTAMTLDASGRLGIGQTSPAYTLDVNGTMRLGSAGSIQPLLSRSSAEGGLLVNTTAGGGAAFIVQNNGTEQARIDSSGNLLVAQTSPNSTANGIGLYNQGSSGSPSWWNYVAGVATDATKGLSLYSTGSSNYRFFVKYDGGISNFQGNDTNLSDRREKTNFAPAGSYLEKICAIPVQTFNYIDQNLEKDDGLTLGVVAQDVQAVAPELVSEDNWGSDEEPKMRLSIYQTDMQYALMKCIQEQQSLITQLTARITALESA